MKQSVDKYIYRQSNFCNFCDYISYGYNLKRSKLTQHEVYLFHYTDVLDL